MAMQWNVYVLALVDSDAAGERGAEGAGSTGVDRHAEAAETGAAARPPAGARADADEVAAQLAGVACELEQCGFPGSRFVVQQSTTLCALPRDHRHVRRAHEELAQEYAKARRWRDENIRRKTNCIPLLFNLLRLLAEKGRLHPLYEAAKRLQVDKQKADQS